MSTPELANVAKEVCNYYKLSFKSFVGKGAFKETFLVEENGSKKALKIYFPDKFNKQRTSREIESILKCDNEYIGKVFLFEKFESKIGEIHFSIDEYLEGGTLTAKIINIGVQDSKKIGLKIADAISHITELDLVHRDLKPDNILFRNKTFNKPVIVDFGLVRDLTSTSLTPSFVQSGPGTPLYSAPEQLNNDKNLIDWRTDQFSLGIILGLCLTKNHPFRNKGEKNLDAIMRIQNRENVANDFKIICKKKNFGGLLKMLEPWPVKRAYSINELKQLINSLGE